jgi:hypothetical protein
MDRTACTEPQCLYKGALNVLSLRLTTVIYRMEGLQYAVCSMHRWGNWKRQIYKICAVQRSELGGGGVRGGGDSMFVVVKVARRYWLAAVVTVNIGRKARRLETGKGIYSK